MSIFDDIVAAIDTLGQVAKIEVGEAALTDIMKHRNGVHAIGWENGLGSTPNKFGGWPFEYRPYLEGWRVTGFKPCKPTRIDPEALVYEYCDSKPPIIQSDDFNEVEARRYARLKAKLPPAPVVTKESFLLLFWDEKLEQWVPHPALLDSERSAAFTATNKAIRNAAYGKTKVIPLGVLGDE